MVILKHGNTMLHGVCNECGCEFLYRRSDIKSMERRINAYNSETEYTYVKCPECECIIKL